MTEFVEKHYSIDAGMGEKMDGCPYSLYEDGHDVQDYIIPPKGYYFAGFRFEPTPDSQVYDGKLVALYEKEQLKERMMPVMQVLAWIIIASIIIGLIVVLTVGIFKPNKPNNGYTSPQTEATLQPAENTIEAQPTESTVAETTETPQETPAETTTETQPATETQPVEETQPATETQPVEETPKPAVTDDNTLFKQEFWTLIHNREIQMDAYDGLYKKYKGKVSGDEYNYLRLTILKDATSYKEWSRKLRKVPADELSKIDTIEALKTKLKAIN